MHPGELKCIAAISIHSPHARRDKIKAQEEGNKPIFQSTLLMRGETRHLHTIHQYMHISIHSPHARRDYCDHCELCVSNISIHSPHARRD